jgi:hypothetical protein
MRGPDLLETLAKFGTQLDAAAVANMWPHVVDALGPETHDIVPVQVHRRWGGVRWEEEARTPGWLAIDVMTRVGGDAEGTKYNGYVARNQQQFPAHPFYPRGFSVDVAYFKDASATFVVPRGASLPAQVVGKSLKCEAPLVAAGRDPKAPPLPDSKQLTKCVIGLASAATGLSIHY